MTKKITLLSILFLLFCSGSACAQADIIDTPIVHNLNPKFYKLFLLNGRVIGMNLENVAGASVTNKRTAESVNTDNNGLYKITVAKGDTIFFAVSNYSKETRIIKNPKENLNVILIKRKTDNLPANHSKSAYNKANAEDDDLYRILEKDAKLEGKWNY